MARYTRGKHAVLMDDRFGRKIKYKDARTEWNGMRVFKGDYEEKQPQLDPQKYMKLGGTDALKNPRPDQDASNQTVTVFLGPLHGNWSGSIAVQPPPSPSEFGGSYVIPLTAPSNQGTTGQGTPTLRLVEDVAGFGLTSQEGTVGLLFNSTEVPPSQLATSSQGTISFSLAEQPTGIQLTTNQGTLILNSLENVSGLQATTGQGTVVNNTAAGVIGTQLAAQQGTVAVPIAEIPPGQEATSQQGSLAFSAAENATGIEATSAQGTLTFLIGNTIDPGSYVATTAQGSVSPAIILEVTGIQASTQQGNTGIEINATENVVGIEMTAQEGTSGLFFNTTELPPGIQSVTEQGSVTIVNSETFTPTGLSSTTNRGTITIALPSWGNNAFGQGEWGK